MVTMLVRCRTPGLIDRDAQGTLISLRMGALLGSIKLVVLGLVGKKLIDIAVGDHFLTFTSDSEYILYMNCVLEFNLQVAVSTNCRWRQ